MRALLVWFGRNFCKTTLVLWQWERDVGTDQVALVASFCRFRERDTFEVFGSCTVWHFSETGDRCSPQLEKYMAARWNHRKFKEAQA